MTGVVLALGGTGYAVTKLPKGSVGSKQLKKKSVGARQLKKNAVTSRKVKNRSLRAKDFKPGQLPSGAAGPQGDPGAAGTQGDAGVAGPQGPAGPAGPATLPQVFQSTTSGSVALTGPLTFTTLESLNLPAGSYVVFGQAILDNGSNGNTGTASCALLAGASTFAFGTEGLNTNTTEDDIALISLEAARVLGAAATVSLACAYGATGSSIISASERRLVAIEAGGVTTQ